MKKIIIGLILTLILINNGRIRGYSVNRSNYFDIPKQIIVSCSPYQDSIMAANDEDSIDWNSENDQARQNACTLSFASLELKQHLEQALSSNIEIKSPKDFDGKPSIILLLASAPQIHEFLSTEEILRTKDISVQGYLVIPKAPHLVIIGYSRIGILYGVYGLLEHLGFRWLAPSSLWTYVPSISGNTQRKWSDIQGSPSFEYRGFWNKGFPDYDFVLWAVRNRFNLVGAVKPALASKLGLHLWAGGHNVIRKALSSDILLFQKHPQWFGLRGGKRHPIQSQGSYYNPCFSNEKMANYIAGYIANQVQSGDYEGVSFLNIWPNDTSSDYYYCQCNKCKALGESINQLLFFYQNLLKRLNILQKAMHLKNQVKIGGISYYKTWNLPDSKYLENLPDNYFHIFYLNQRSFTEPIFLKDHKCDNNAKFAAAIRNWIKIGAKTKVKFGVCEYYNYSIYGGLAKTFKDVIPLDLKAYHDMGFRLFAYMHPIKGDPGPRRLTNRFLSSLAWDIQLLGEDIEKDYFIKFYPGIENEMREIYSLFDNSLSNMKEMFGQNSLSNNLFQESYWSHPPYTESQILEYIPLYLEGGNQYLPGRPYFEEDYRVSFIGLEQSILQLQKGLNRLEELSRKSFLQQDVRQRLRIDIQWYRTSYFRYSLLWNLAKWRLFQLEKYVQGFYEALNFLESTPLLDRTISSVNQRTPAIGWRNNDRVIIPK